LGVGYSSGAGGAARPSEGGGGGGGGGGGAAPGPPLAAAVWPARPPPPAPITDRSTPTALPITGRVAIPDHSSAGGLGAAAGAIPMGNWSAAAASGAAGALQSAIKPRLILVLTGRQRPDAARSPLHWTR